jgi:hypothetical protein
MTPILHHNIFDVTETTSDVLSTTYHIYNFYIKLTKDQITFKHVTQ